ncbi:MAG TPA: GNAT family N-acetyltransferase [Longimicrobiales bacterium]|nr:GNAT family N-acetyltransferase [Longimicrobiales bacterium]
MLHLGAERAPDVVDVLCEAFFDYPVMRYVLGPAGTSYDERLRKLVGLFVMARVLREETLLGIEGRSGLDATAIVSRPGRQSPPAFRELSERVWSELGATERARYESFGAACAPFQVEAPHLHLNMVGVRRRAQGRGLGRRLIERVHELSRADPHSVGVTLTTEDPRNLALYEHLGYGIVGHAVVAAELQTWGFYRAD